jgi:hypothetical protein
VSGLWIRLAPRGALLLAATRLGHSAILPELPAHIFLTSTKSCADLPNGQPLLQLN